MNQEQGQKLLELARISIHQEFDPKKEMGQTESWMKESGACFITLKKKDALRGCIGSLEPHRSLKEDVIQNAKASAFRDPRFPSVRFEELSEIRIEISVLQTPEVLSFSSEKEALALITPKADGLILKCGSKRATFLPQVWETLPDKQRFLSELKRKAGLPTDFWSDHLRLWKYGVEKWEESE